MAEATASALALIVTAVLSWPTIKYLERRGIVDSPNRRSSHAEAIPRGGGVAVLLSLMAACGAAGGPAPLWLLLAVVSAAAAVGLADDLRDVPAPVRLAVQSVLAAAACMIVVLAQLPSRVPTAVFVVVAVIWFVGYVNAFNFMDGINGISAVSGALAGGWFLLLGSVHDEPVLGVGGAALLGACLGFLPWNCPRARVFLGDVGSYGLGALIGSLSLWAAATDDVDAVQAVAPLLVYVTDTGSTLLRRGLRRESLFEAHREHVYQRLCDTGLTHLASTLVVATASVAVCSLLWWLPVGAGALGAAVVLVGYLVLPELRSRDRRQPKRTVR